MDHSSFVPFSPQVSPESHNLLCHLWSQVLLPAPPPIPQSPPTPRGVQPLVSGSDSPCSLQPRWEKGGGVAQRSECSTQTRLSASCIRISYESLFQTGSISLPVVSSFPIDRILTLGACARSSGLKSIASDDQIPRLYLPSPNPQATGAFLAL